LTLARAESRLPTREEFGRQLDRGRVELDRQRAALRGAAAQIREMAAKLGHVLSDDDLYEGGPEILNTTQSLASARAAAQLQVQNLQSFEQKLLELRFTVKFADKPTRGAAMPPLSAAQERARERLAKSQVGVAPKLQRFRKFAADSAIPLTPEGLLDGTGARTAVDQPDVMKAWERAAEALAVLDSAATLVASLELRDAAGPIKQPW
jgi:hypothetical protein